MGKGRIGGKPQGCKCKVPESLMWLETLMRVAVHTQGSIRVLSTVCTRLPGSATMRNLARRDVWCSVRTYAIVSGLACKEKYKEHAPNRSVHKPRSLKL